MSDDALPASDAVGAKRVPIWRLLYAQVLAAIVLGVLVGMLAPAFGAELKVLGDAFTRLIRMVLAPVVFATVALGIARMADIKKLGRLGAMTLIYFEVVSTLALAIGLIVANVARPGAGLNIDPATLDQSGVAPFIHKAAEGGLAERVLAIIPANVVAAFAAGDILPILFFAVIFGVGLSLTPKTSEPFIRVLDSALGGLFSVMGIVMRLAPIAAFGGMAFTVGKFGWVALAKLLGLGAAVYGASALFVLVVLGLIAGLAGFSLLRFLAFIKDELFIVLGTCSSESVLPRLMQKLEAAGCARPVVGLVMPAGIVFNPDGSAIYLSLAVLFIAQATNTPLDLAHQLGLMAVLMLTSKGSAGVSGAGFIALAATLETTSAVPVAGLALLLGVDRFMNEARAVTNTIGNAVATVVIARWGGLLDRDAFRGALREPFAAAPATSEPSAS
jgi:aerobic C4-dicarboxylate transport protein